MPVATQCLMAYNKQLLDPETTVTVCGAAVSLTGMLFESTGI